jgi:hypothetical protein
MKGWKGRLLELKPDTFVDGTPITIRTQTLQEVLQPGLISGSENGFKSVCSDIRSASKELGFSVKFC